MNFVLKFCQFFSIVFQLQPPANLQRATCHVKSSHSCRVMIGARFLRCTGATFLRCSESEFLRCSGQPGSDVLWVRRLHEHSLRKAIKVRNLSQSPITNINTSVPHNSGLESRKCFLAFRHLERVAKLVWTSNRDKEEERSRMAE